MVKKMTTILILMLGLIHLSAAFGISYNDKVMIANFINLAGKDLEQTRRKVSIGGVSVEKNPIARTFIGDKEATSLIKLLGSSFAVKLALDTESDQGTSVCLFIYNLINVWALRSSGEKAQMMFGYAF